jgi:hypothetical protein
MGHNRMGWDGMRLNSNGIGFENTVDENTAHEW